MRRIDTDEDVAEGLAALASLDPRLSRVIERAGPVPLRRVPPGFASLVGIVVAQQVSRASADAIMGRLVRLVEPLDAPSLLAAGEDSFRAAGLSRPKQRTVLALAETVAAGGLDLDGLADAEADDAIARLTAVPGIGPWTAEVWLLACAGHADVFPARDVALQGAVADALALDARPGHRELSAMAESWSPWRSVAARLLWAWWRKMRGREAAPMAGIAEKPAITG